MYFYQQDCHKAANCRYCFYSQAKNQHFHPTVVTCCTDSCEIWHDQGARGSAWPHEISRQSVHGVGMQPPKWQKFLLFGKESPHRGKPFDRFLQLLGVFIRPLFYTPALAFYIRGDSLYRLRSYCWETSRRSFSPKFFVHPVGKTMRWIDLHYPLLQ